MIRVHSYTCPFLRGVQFFALPSPLSKTGAIPQIPHTPSSQFRAVIASKAKYPSYNFLSKYHCSSDVNGKLSPLSDAASINECALLWTASPCCMWLLISNRTSNDTKSLQQMLKTPVDNRVYHYCVYKFRVVLSTQNYLLSTSDNCVWLSNLGWGISSCRLLPGAISPLSAGMSLCYFQGCVQVAQEKFYTTHKYHHWEEILGSI